MVDLLIVLSCVGAMLAFISVGNANRAVAEKTNGDLTIGTIQQRVGELERELGDLRIRLSTEQANVRVFRDAFEPFLGGDSTISPGAIDEILKNYREFEQSVSGIPDLKAKVQKAEDSARASIEDAKRLAEEVASTSKRADVLAEELRAARQAAKNSGDVAEERAKDAQEAAAREAAAAQRAENAASVAREAQAAVSGMKDEQRNAGAIRQELLGIRGSMTNTVFVIDRSLSMERGGRWEAAKLTIKTWIDHLPVARSSMILFGSDVKVLPATSDSPVGRAWDSVELPELTPQVRISLLDELSALSPAGQTRTATALRRAMEFTDIDCIILFTDGTPDTSSEGPAGDPRQEVIDLVASWRSSHPNARVHTVGIGDYFNPSMRDFLHGVARAGNGAFIGR
jgi:hypothetical protein